MNLPMPNYRLRSLLVCVALLARFPASAQVVASHAPTEIHAESSTSPMANSQVQVTGKPVARVNGVVLTDRDLLREMYAIFPYARQHSGFPKGMEPEIRKGAMEMLIFEELVYQEAVRRGMAISAPRMKRAQASLRQQYGSPQEFDQYLRAEFNGSPQALHRAIRRSLLIEALLKAEVRDKAKISLAQARAYYDKNPTQFQHPESFSIQTISIIPPQNPSAANRKEARKRVEDALRRAKATKSYLEFGLLAEKVSDDDWHVAMGDRKAVERTALPPPVVDAALAMKPGEVSDLIPLGDNYTLFRLNAHAPAGRTKFEEVKDKLRTDLEKEKYLQLRSELNKKLRQYAKVEEP